MTLHDVSYTFMCLTVFILAINQLMMSRRIDRLRQEIWEVKNELWQNEAARQVHKDRIEKYGL